LLVAVISTMLTELYRLLTAEVIEFSWTKIKPVLYIGLTTGISYVLKNFFSNSKGEFAKSEKERSNLVEDGPGGSSNPPEDDRPDKP